MVLYCGYNVKLLRHVQRQRDRTRVVYYKGAAGIACVRPRVVAPSKPADGKIQLLL